MVLSAVDELSGYAELTTRYAAVWLPRATLWCLSGVDRLEWLQGQATCDVRKLGPGSPLLGCFVSPTGQLQAECRIYDRGEVTWVVCEPGEVLKARADDFVIMEDVGLELLSSGLWSIQGPDVGSLEVEGALPANRLYEGGLDLSGSCPTEVSVASFESFLCASLELGIPLVGVDSDDRTLPPELGLGFERSHVAYDKGCYQGQEVLQRIHSRGHTNKSWFVLKCGSLATPGSAVTSLEGRAVGTVTRSATSPRFGHLAGAMAKNEYAAPGSRLLIGTEEVVACAFPLNQ